MITTLMNSIDRRLRIYEDMQLFQLASILHPRFKMDWYTEGEVFAMKDLLKSKVAELTSDVATTSVTETTEAPPKKKCKLFRFMVPSNSPPPPSTSFHSQVESYLRQQTAEEETDPRLFWQQHESTFPELTKLALQYLSIPASSAPVKRLSSIAGKVFRPERWKMSYVRFEELMFKKCNATSILLKTVKSSVKLAAGSCLPKFQSIKNMYIIFLKVYL